MPEKRKPASRDDGPTTNLSARVPNELAAVYREASATTGRAQNRLVIEALTLYAGALGVGWMGAPDPNLAGRRIDRTGPGGEGA